MPKLQRVFIGAVVTCLMFPGTSSAQIGKGWLERLSGPGPFSGPTVEVRFLCLATSSETQDRISIDEETIGGRLLMPQRKNAGVWLSPLACHFINNKDPRLEVGIQYSWLDSSDNALDYSQRSIPSGGTKVELNVMLFTADLRVNQVLDVGAAIGSGSFSSSSGLFDDFSRAVYQPLRVTTRPLSAFIDDRWAEVLQIRFDGTKFKDGFRAEDFGARPDSYNDPGEIVWAWAVKLDITPFLWRR